MWLGKKYFLDHQGSDIATHLVLLLVVVLAGATIFKKPNAPSFQVELG